MLLEVIRFVSNSSKIRTVLPLYYVISQTLVQDAAFKALHIHLGKSDGNRCYLAESPAVRH
jgi:hypothetical protein